MTTTSTPPDRKLAIAVAVAGAGKPSASAPRGYPDHPWAYFAEEAHSWWAVSTESMIKLADMIAARGGCPRGRRDHRLGRAGQGRHRA